MDHFMEGYQTYCRACETYGLQSMSYYLYVKHLTEEQLNAYNKYNNETAVQAGWTMKGTIF